jgi:pectate lyase
VFDVGGYIVLKSPVSVLGNITIAGQTAPGDGIGIMGGEVSLSNKSNIIVRGLRVRQGNLDPLTGKSAVGASNTTNFILDHCSIEYGEWDSFDADHFSYAHGTNGNVVTFSLQSGAPEDLTVDRSLATVTAVPEPASLAQMATGFALLAGALRRRRV